MLCSHVSTLLLNTKRFSNDVSASFLPIFAVSAFLVIVVTGAAIDMSNAYKNRDQLAQALDAAALTVATELSVNEMSDTEIENLLKASFEANLEGMGLKGYALSNLSFTVDPDMGTIEVSSSVSADTTFMRMGGMGPETIDIGVEAMVNYSRFDVEIALIVDVTGSMSSSDMRTLRTASTALVDILIPADTDTNDSKFRIALVPYSQGVNLGEYADQVRGGVYYPLPENDCVTERQDYGSENVALTDKPYDYFEDFEDGEAPPYETFYGYSYGCSSSSEMIPLTADRTKLLPAIDALRDSGGTAGHTGVIWGWNALSPNYSDVWPEESWPASYNDDDVNKYAIIMTDGDNNRYYDYGNYCTGPWWNRTCSDQWVELSESVSYNNQSSQTQRDLCDNMKAAGIKVYSVYFGSNNSSVGARNMQSCATEYSSRDSNTYYQATNNEELINAFGNIAKRIQAIYLAM
ncbi:Flp pilus assembly protein TadG [Roseibium hamelinense]|uniref:Flp pilus assembly protein TadG n=1 Tax=Roseibium hamelinense TaxID=150831 RepID=A0A562SNW1_9HYPH|nr:pilus assembly protein TadG-related protein [Roseibium hamelinense]MTI44000.1 pilus assembly protein TadG [Roseibium hamelinense]TWI82793.1 Flp pilus assembly protein TadG [Roseibium hamelinense]